MRVSAAFKFDSEFSEDVHRGLSRPGQKQLSAKYFYDEVGSALFDVITLLPEYGLTRADNRLLERHSDALLQRSQDVSLIVELGSGSGSKTRPLVSLFAGKQPLTYCPVDVSQSALERCVQELRPQGSVEVVPFAESYLDGLRFAIRKRTKGAPLLLLFLGSTLGNFDATEAREFLASIRQLLLPGDLFLLSTDLQKERERLIAAYNDSIGVTAAFNLNLLARINRDLAGDFDLSQFAHQVRYNTGAHRIEMHLRSLVNQTAHIGNSFRVALRQGETIWTESSYKFRCEDIVSLATLTGFDCEIQWVDEEWPFAQSLLRAM